MIFVVHGCSLVLLMQRLRLPEDQSVHGPHLWGIILSASMNEGAILAVLSQTSSLMPCWPGEHEGAAGLYKPASGFVTSKSCDPSKLSSLSLGGLV